MNLIPVAGGGGQPTQSSNYAIRNLSFSVSWLCFPLFCFIPKQYEGSHEQLQDLLPSSLANPGREHTSFPAGPAKVSGLTLIGLNYHTRFPEPIIVVWEDEVT